MVASSRVLLLQAGRLGRRRQHAEVVDQAPPGRPGSCVRGAPNRSVTSPPRARSTARRARVPERGAEVHERDFRAALRDGEDLVPGAADDGMRGAVRHAPRGREARVRRVARDARRAGAGGARFASAVQRRRRRARCAGDAALARGAPRPRGPPHDGGLVFEASVRERQADGARDGPAAARDADQTLHGAQPSLDELARAVDGVHEHRQDVHGLLPLGRVRGIRAYQISSERVVVCCHVCRVGRVVLVLLADDAQPGPRSAQRVHDGHLRVRVRLGERRARVVRVLARGRQRARARAARLHGADLVAALQRGVHARRQQLAHGDELRGCRGGRDDGHRGGRAGTRGRGAPVKRRSARGRFEATRVACTRETRAHQVDSMRGPPCGLEWIGVGPAIGKTVAPTRSAHRHKNLARTLKAGVGEGNSDAKVCSNAAVMLPAVFHHRRALSECRETSLRSRQDALLPRLSVVLLVLGRLFAADADLVFLL